LDNKCESERREKDEDTLLPLFVLLVEAEVVDSEAYLVETRQQNDETPLVLVLQGVYQRDAEDYGNDIRMRLVDRHWVRIHIMLEVEERQPTPDRRQDEGRVDELAVELETHQDKQGL